MEVMMRGGGGRGGLAGFVDDLEDGVDEGIDPEDVVEPEADDVDLRRVAELEVDAKLEGERLLMQVGMREVVSTRVGLTRRENSKN